MLWGELTGDAELKTDCNKPPTDLDAMGIYSDVLVFSEDQIGTVRHCWEVLGLIGGAEVTRPGFFG